MRCCDPGAVPAADAPIRRRLVVRGQVQGVFFRDTCRQEATARGVAGSAANRDDGSVEIVLEGPPAAVEEVIAWARHGPDAARVDGVGVHEEQPRGDVRGFDISGSD